VLENNHIITAVVLIERDSVRRLRARGLYSSDIQEVSRPFPSRRFPPPWSVEEADACFIVCDANRQALA
jgi:hypothetical protein